MEKIRLQYIDLLKFFSILAIISIHAFMVWRDSQILGFDIYAFCEICRFGIPVFIMVSGALLLNRNIEIKPFLQKKVKRLVYPFIFFYILTFIFLVLMHKTHDQMQIFAFRWYFWMILGVYLSIPIINKFIQHSSIKEIEYFIALFIFATIFYQVTYYFNLEQYFYLTLFLSPLGYLVLGYYLSIKDFNLSPNKMISICIILFITSTLIKSCGELHLIPLVDNFIANQSKMLHSWVDVGFFEIVQSASMFLLCKNIYDSRDGVYSYINRFLQSNLIQKFIISISKASYGIYLINLIPTVLFYYYLQPLSLTGTQICIVIFTFSISTLVMSWIVILIFSKIPFIKDLSGYA